jgi:hypothetical protein
MTGDEKAASGEPRAASQAEETAPPVPIAPPYSRFEIRLYGDTAGRQFSRLINRDGQPDKFRGSIVIAKA